MLEVKKEIEKDRFLLELVNRSRELVNQLNQLVNLLIDYVFLV